MRLHPVGRDWIFLTVGAAAMLLAVLVPRLLPGGRDAAPDLCGRGELLVAGGTDVSLNDRRLQLISEWNSGAADRPGRLKARLVEVSPSADEQYSEMKAALEARGCAYDVLITDNTWTAQFAELGYLRPLGKAADADFIPAGLATGRRDGTQYALPFNLDVGLLYAKRGQAAPADWPALLAGPTVTQLADREGLTVNALEAVWNDGDPRFAGSRRPSVGELRTSVFPAVRRLAERVRSSPTLRGSLSDDEQASIEAFENGAPGAPRLMRNWPYAFFSLAATPSLRDGAGLAFQVSALPGRTVLGGQNLAIAKDSPHPAEARALIDFLTSAGAERDLFACGGFAPSRYSALGLRPPDRVSPGDVRVEACRPSGGGTPAQEETVLPDRAQLTRLGQVIVQALARAQPRPQSVHYASFSATFRGCVAKMAGGGRVDAASFAEAVDRSLDGRTASC
ncbi:extracellular solute-binding protein [Actinomadura parmotrematis]|uniref:Extracellular solute-binding protein n=1 Tax=Actinomadura parmotrematis TaxID=2864039 RepID=A0ABS7FYS9_9ACTN|nr:extracellular solute-binding protein [Actinomadura parmotrematis]MBW8485600.1 extracellular solute-binding protein [Actinomadura parmotrematis]